jgi:hypothetical protein
MKELEDLIQTANRLSLNLDKASDKEKEFPFEVCLRLEQMSWEIFRAANELRELSAYL